MSLLHQFVCLSLKRFLSFFVSLPLFIIVSFDFIFVSLPLFEFIFVFFDFIFVSPPFVINDHKCSTFSENKVNQSEGQIMVQSRSLAYTM